MKARRLVVLGSARPLQAHWTACESCGSAKQSPGISRHSAVLLWLRDDVHPAKVVSSELMLCRYFRASTAGSARAPPKNEGCLTHAEGLSDISGIAGSTGRMRCLPLALAASVALPVLLSRSKRCPRTALRAEPFGVEEASAEEVAEYMEQKALDDAEEAAERETDPQVNCICLEDTLSLSH